jgi:NADH pyrophosphatase NudC (nudix superfamily)
MSDAAYRFCPTCGSPLEARTLKTGDRERMACTACGFIHYLDPKVAVGTIIRAPDERLVLVTARHRTGIRLVGVPWRLRRSRRADPRRGPS